MPATSKPRDQKQLLGKARSAKKDEFYTQLPDIERELKHYTEQFKGKVVYCNADDPRISNFFHYFSHNFERLGLKKLITTCYKNQERDLFSRHDSEQAIYLEYNGDKNDNRVPDPDEIGVHPLEGDGDFRSPECVALLKQADIVVTNPPFSLFREYITQLVEHDKKFLIVGNQNAITYKEVFSLIRDDKLWLGFGFKRNMAHFYSPYEASEWVEQEGDNVVRVSGVQWFTNLDLQKRHEELILYRSYNPDEYPTYDNYDGIEVANTVDIPMDYDGNMGVPITFLNKYNPEQFEIVGSFNAGAHGEELGATKTEAESKGKVLMWNGPVVNRKPIYKRIVIRRRSA
ncbi:MAG: adenine-specific methyltransferase EcoRI family protein [Ilumatobacter sp.]|uniref:adenine-specific methyltransferase EcoRI family protein n=1 Tax=Ilumatobacter sp. TaxID=1967498 RepID=UPI003299994D